MSILAKNVRLIRKELRCTQSAMAKIVKIGFRTYVRYEAGERDAPVSVLIKLARLGNISLEQLLTQVISSHDISPAPKLSKSKTFPETKLVDFRKGEIVFREPASQELMAIDSSEKRLLTLFRKMDIDSQKLCVNNIQETVNADSPALTLRSLTVRDIKKIPGRSGRKKANKKLLKEKIDRLKMITKSINRITVK